MKLLTTPQDLERELRRLIKGYSEYYWATAWATSSISCFSDLLKRKGRIKKLLVGTHFYQTDPGFIEKFVGAKNVRFIMQPSGVFHPKLFVFQNSPQDWEMLVGSANFTRGALSDNTEASILIDSQDPGAVRAYEKALALIDSHWPVARVMTTERLAGYRKVWDNQQQKLKSLSGKYGSRKGKPGKPIPEVPVITMSWDKFHKRVLAGERGDYMVEVGVKVIEKTRSWFERLDREGKGFSDLPEDNRKAIAGTLSFQQSEKKFGIEFGWFGSMRGNGFFKKAIIDNNKRVSRALDEIPFTGEVSKAQHMAFWDHFGKLHRCELATGTRLLAMKRPDTFVCLDSKNRQRLSRDFKIAAYALGYEGYWDDIIGRIQDSVWWNSPQPKVSKEAAIWKARAAFLDAIYYEDK